MKSNSQRKTDIITLIFLLLYLMILIVGFVFAIKAKGIYPYIMTVVALMLLCLLIFFHSRVNLYKCRYCDHEFKLGFFKDAFSPNGIRRSKYVKCPNCGRRGWAKEASFRN